MNRELIDFTERDAEKSDKYPALLPRNTGSDTTLDFFVSQYTRCREQHAKCQLSAPPNNFLPNRLIDIGIDGGSFVRLRDGDELPAGSPYVALSHCWGKTPLFILTQDTFVELKEGVTVTRLPKTFQDAIVATRKLRFRYLWIDSLCIFQDDLDNWHVEASHMRDIYSKAVCCIAATAAKDGSTGLFFDREPRGLAPMQVQVTGAHETTLSKFLPPGKYWCGCHLVNTNSAIDKAPLNQRAWVAQERYLSPRILHFSRDVLFWECFELIANEVYPDGVPNLRHDDEYDTRNLKAFVGHIRRGSMEANTTIQGNNALVEIESSSETISQLIYSSWCTFRLAYTGCGMTKEKDILVALSGIVQDVAEAMNDECIAGLWKNRFLEDLCWQCNGPRFMDRYAPTYRPSKWRAPSWSWASTISPVKPTFRASYRVQDNKSLRSMATVKAFSVNAQPSGELKSASVTMECHLIPVKLHIYDSLCVGTVKFLDEVVPHRELFISFDSPRLEYVSGESYILHLLPLRCYHNDDDPVEAYVEGLVIAPSQNKSGAYERMASFDKFYFAGLETDANIVLRLLSKYNETESQTIELV